ncbi:MAG: hypothetical protein H6708_09605 [Kofleriaceae bacterium]|nr:hypothetical protein [Kofleriaceae bacterium]
MHEALGARWPQLRSWLDETRVERELLDDARSDAERWRRAGRPPDLLWRGARLAAVTGLRDRLGDAGALIDASLAAEGGQRRQRRALFAVGVGLAAVAIAAALAWYGSDAARQRAVRARSAPPIIARAEAEHEAATNRELRAGAEDERRAAERARARRGRGDRGADPRRGRGPAARRRGRARHRRDPAGRRRGAAPQGRGRRAATGHGRGRRRPHRRRARRVRRALPVIRRRSSRAAVTTPG